MRVATNTIQTNLLKEMQQSNRQINDASYQISTGKRAQQLSDMAPDAAKLLSFQEAFNSSDIYIQNLETVGNRLEATESALNSMEDLMVEAAQLWTLARTENSAETRATIAPKAEGLLNNFYNLLNSEFEGRHLFSGQDAGTAPISGTPAAAVYGGNPPSTTYYNGDSAKANVITGPGTTDTYGLTGDELAFARIKQGLESLWYGLENDSDTDIDGAVTLLEQAREDVSDLVGQVGGEMANFQLLSDRHTETQNFIQEQMNELEQVDITEAMTQFTQYQASLEASMLVITRLNGLSLLDFI